jgi:hypothetical protein
MCWRSRRQPKRKHKAKALGKHFVLDPQQRGKEHCSQDEYAGASPFPDPVNLRKAL